MRDEATKGLRAVLMEAVATLAFVAFILFASLLFVDCKPVNRGTLATNHRKTSQRVPRMSTELDSVVSTSHQRRVACERTVPCQPNECVSLRELA